ncbi:LysR family transcriptional regulator [Hyphococcus sp.]|jgi:DNA-binding transcriptional LysR family regulator|uniref:LysR family transcriptional regulator n=1 Tax=Hyphococcus sp. TaxID=2038636 RepID=UPI003D098296
MDITSAKTFLAVIEGGSFVAAARRVHVTQSTVSARIKALEDELGKILFIRTKAACDLTPAGHQFHRYALSLVRIWEEAKHQVAVPEGFEDTLIVGGQYSLWNRLLLWWVPAFRAAAPKVALRCEIGTPPRLMREMAEGVMDLAVIHQPEHRPGMVVRELLEDRLILVTTDASIPFQDNYIFADWGEGFRTMHAAAHPDLMTPAITLDLGALGINILLNMRGAAYFPERIVQPHLEKGMLSLVKGAPDFPYPAYVVYQQDFAAPAIMEQALQTLFHTAERSLHGDLPKPYWM